MKYIYRIKKRHPTTTSSLERYVTILAVVASLLSKNRAIYAFRLKQMLDSF